MATPVFDSNILEGQDMPSSSLSETHPTCSIAPFSSSQCRVQVLLVLNMRSMSLEHSRRYTTGSVEIGKVPDGQG